MAPRNGATTGNQTRAPFRVSHKEVFQWQTIQEQARQEIVQRATFTGRPMQRATVCVCGQHRPGRGTSRRLFSRSVTNFHRSHFQTKLGVGTSDLTRARRVHRKEVSAWHMKRERIIVGPVSTSDLIRTRQRPGIVTGEPLPETPISHRIQQEIWTCSQRSLTVLSFNAVSMSGWKERSQISRPNG
jgi:hypothetical protein